MYKTFGHIMNSPQYRNAYMANLKLEISNNAKNLKANVGNPAVTQYIQNISKPAPAVTQYILQNISKPAPKPVQKKK